MEVWKYLRLNDLVTSLLFIFYSLPPPPLLFHFTSPLGFLGMDTYGDVLHNAMASKGAGRAGGRRSIVDRMERQG